MSLRTEEFKQKLRVAGDLAKQINNGIPTYNPFDDGSDGVHLSKRGNGVYFMSDGDEENIGSIDEIDRLIDNLDDMLVSGKVCETM